MIPALLTLRAQRVCPTRIATAFCSGTGTGSAPQVPLVEQPARHTVSADAFVQVIEQLKAAVPGDAQSFSGSEAPGPDDLQRELTWLAEDVMQDTGPKDGPWTATTWQALKTRSSAADALSVKLRLSLDEITAIWRQRIEERLPYQYLVGAAHWRDMILAVGPGVLIPRPETEVIVDFIEDHIHQHPELSLQPWVDLGCGSGALTIALARMQSDRRKALAPSGKGPACAVVATDISESAIAYTRLNAHRLGVADKVDARLGSWCQPCSDVLGKVGVLVSNPPYIPADDMAGLQLEVGRHEPTLALCGGHQGGTDCIDDVIECAASLLQPGGTVVIETNAGRQAEDMVERMRCLQRLHAAVFKEVGTKDDYYGRNRFVCAIRV